MNLKRPLPLFMALLLILSMSFVPTGAGAAIYVEPELQATLDSAISSEQLEAIVNYDPGLTSSTTLTAAIQDLGVGTITFNHLDSIAVIGTASQITLIGTLTGVTGLYANAVLDYYLDDSVSFIGAKQAWSDPGVTGKGVGVAVIDTGIDATHPDLAFPAKTVQNVKIITDPTAVYNFKGKANRPLYLENQENTDTSSGHGTHVAGTAAGDGTVNNSYAGVAKDAHLLGIGAGDALFVSWALAGFDYVIDNASEYNIKVVNNSWGSSRQAQNYDPNHPINKASKKAHDRAITVVFAAGNSGPGEDTMNHYAMAPWVIGVAAGCTTDQGVADTSVRCEQGSLLARFSSRGVPGDPQFHPTLTAPGVWIAAARASTGAAINALTVGLNAYCAPQDPVFYTCANGTSMASPHIAGTVALLQEAADGTLTPDQVKQLLIDTARPMTRPDDTLYEAWEVGAGYVDALAAVKAVSK